IQTAELQGRAKQCGKKQDRKTMPDEKSTGRRELGELQEIWKYSETEHLPLSTVHSGSVEWTMYTYVSTLT
ncbi:hypothetical protein NDU88_000886, partial [Pleurodeles waltl]